MCHCKSTGVFNLKGGFLSAVKSFAFPRWAWLFTLILHAKPAEGTRSETKRYVTAIRLYACQGTPKWKSKLAGPKAARLGRKKQTRLWNGIIYVKWTTLSSSASSCQNQRLANSRGPVQCLEGKFGLYYIIWLTRFWFQRLLQPCKINWNPQVCPWPCATLVDIPHQVFCKIQSCRNEKLTHPRRTVSVC